MFEALSPRSVSAIHAPAGSMIDTIALSDQNKCDLQVLAGNVVIG